MTQLRLHNGARTQWPSPIEVGLLFAGALIAVRYAIGFLDGQSTVGADYGVFRDIFTRVASGGPVYPAFELAGPFTSNYAGGIGVPVSLYPPFTTALYAITLLPAIFWWLIPVTITVAMLAWTRPAPWGWALILVCLFPAQSVSLVVAGNVDIWIVAFLALSLRWRWVSALVLLKPSVFPFALFGMRHRRWWVTVAVLGIASLALWPLTLDWLRAMGNVRGDRSGLLYSLSDWPLLAIPLVAWVGRKRREPVRSPAGRTA